MRRQPGPQLLPRANIQQGERIASHSHQQSPGFRPVDCTQYLRVPGKDNVPKGLPVLADHLEPAILGDQVAKLRSYRDAASVPRAVLHVAETPYLLWRRRHRPEAVRAASVLRVLVGHRPQATDPHRGRRSRRRGMCFEAKRQAGNQEERRQVAMVYGKALRRCASDGHCSPAIPRQASRKSASSTVSPK